MRYVIAAFAMGIVITVAVLTQHPDTKPHEASQASPAAQPQRPDRIRVKEDVQKAKLVHRVRPVYPPIINTKPMEGTVVLHVLIGKKGAVKSAKYVSGPTNLATSAIDAVLQWRYKPTLMNGRLVEVDTTVSVVFSLRGKKRSLRR